MTFLRHEHQRLGGMRGDYHTIRESSEVLVDREYVTCNAEGGIDPANSVPLGMGRPLATRRELSRHYLLHRVGSRCGQSRRLTST